MPTDEFLKNDAFLTTELLKLAVEAAGIGVWKVDPQTRNVELTAVLKRMLGIPVDQPVNYAAFFAALHPDDQAQARDDLARALTAPDGMCETEFRVVTPADGVRWLSARGQAFFDGEGESRRPTLFIGTARDVTDAKIGLEQQQMLLHEVNHRVKNSLQLVSSLLRLQARRIPDAAARRQLEDATTRISTIAHIHQRLYRDQDVKKINFGAFLSELCADLQGSAVHCSLEVSSPNFPVTTDRAIPLALVVNELVTNAFKYAYPAEGAGGRVSVTVDLHGDEEIAITVKDDGVGLPDGFSVAGGTNLGMILIGSLLTQLSGQIEIRHDGPGTCFLVTVPVEDRA
jgi:two-component system, sensor histidine kinase PdtaS